MHLYEPFPSGFSGGFFYGLRSAANAVILTFRKKYQGSYVTMQKGDRSKLKLLLIGIKARLEQNRDYFVRSKLYLPCR